MFQIFPDVKFIQHVLILLIQLLVIVDYLHAIGMMKIGFVQINLVQMHLLTMILLKNVQLLILIAQLSQIDAQLKHAKMLLLL